MAVLVESPLQMIEVVELAMIMARVVGRLNGIALHPLESILW
jgi:hypothetical protein